MHVKSSKKCNLDIIQFVIFMKFSALFDDFLRFNKSTQFMYKLTAFWWLQKKKVVNNSVLYWAHLIYIQFRII